MAYRKLKTANKASRLEQLRTLRGVLAEKIDGNPGARDLAQLAKQYRDTVKEIEEIEQEKDFTSDEVGDILAERAAAGKPGAIR